jgi:hypothetical protein
LHEAVGENARESGSDATEEIEETVSLADLVCRVSVLGVQVKRRKRTRHTPCVPCAEEVDAAREETGFQETEKNAKGSELLKVVDEAHAYHDTTPEHRDQRQVNARADLSNEHGGRRLEGDIRGEEDEVGDLLPGLESITFLV